LPLAAFSNCSRDVLDLSKIEAGQLSLTLEDYAVGQVVQTVRSSTESLARAKGLVLTAKVQDGMPIGRGDERRLTGSFEPCWERDQVHR
jgi:signal transduction histidine kinase